MYMVKQKTWGEKMNEIPVDWTDYFTTKYWVLWLFILMVFPPLFFIWIPLQIYFFFFHWPGNQTSADEVQNERNQLGEASPSFNPNADNKDSKEEEGGSWWNLGGAPAVGQDMADDGWWKRI